MENLTVLSRPTSLQYSTSPVLQSSKFIVVPLGPINANRLEIFKIVVLWRYGFIRLCGSIL
jgi:hypothetical protein